MQKKYASQGFQVIAVNGWNEPKDDLKKFADKEKLAQKILLMGGKVSDELYHAKDYPTSFWINHEGRIVDREVGFNPEMFSKMEGHAEKLLGAKKKAARAAGP